MFTDFELSIGNIHLQPFIIFSIGNIHFRTDGCSVQLEDAALEDLAIWANYTSTNFAM